MRSMPCTPRSSTASIARPSPTTWWTRPPKRRASRCFVTRAIASSATTASASTCARCGRASKRLPTPRCGPSCPSSATASGCRAWARIRDTEAERAFWRRCNKPDVRFYVEHNPGYGEGHGLLMLVPVTPALIAGGLARIAQEKGGHRLERVRARARQLPLASRLLVPREVRRRLRSVPLFEGLDDARLDALAARAEVVSHPADRAGWCAHRGASAALARDR